MGLTMCLRPRRLLCSVCILWSACSGVINLQQTLTPVPDLTGAWSGNLALRGNTAI